MILEINSIIYYGRYYSTERQEYENLWWLCLIDYQIYGTQTLIEKYSYLNESEIKDLGIYIAMFKTDIIAIEKQFMKNYDEKAIFKIQNTCLNKDYDIAFKIYIEQCFLEQVWYIYERRVLCNDAIKWCKQNHIPYIELREM